jgi:hypothetical protein
VLSQLPTEESLVSLHPIPRIDFSIFKQFVELRACSGCERKAGKKRTYRRRSKRRRRRRLIIFGEGVILGVTTTGFKTKLKAGEEEKGGGFPCFLQSIIITGR